MSVVLAAPAAAVGPAITLAKSGDLSVLAGGTARFTLTASNPGSNTDAVPEYNTSFRDVLPAGVTYQAGSTSPADAGNPTIITDPVSGGQTLIWRDAVDLQINASDTVAFSVNVDATALPVGSSFANTADAYASSAPRTVPAFTATGVPVADPNVQAATSNTTTTTVSALRITKDEPSPERELLRGVHDHKTTYTVTVTNTGEAATTGTTAVDYLPATQEFLGCGGVDNTSDGAVEYVGAPRLSAGTTLAPSQCPDPASVDTVTDPAGLPAGVYTKVTWTVGTLDPGEVRTIRYLAAIPLRENVMFGADAPTPESLQQAANLDNNTGPSTRQNGTAAASTNYATVDGTYTGNLSSGTPPEVTAQTSHSVTINDLRMHKSVSPAAFQAGDAATYTLVVDSGEYTDNSAITITDVMPNGVCPLDDISNFMPGAPADCAPDAGFAPSLPYQSVTQNGDGTFTVTFEPINVNHGNSTTITYQSRMRATYAGGGLAGTPTSAGDSFTNRAVEAGTSTPVAATGFTGNLPVTDPTSATQRAGGGSLAKAVAARATPMDCNTAAYGAVNPTFAEGDRMCFQISAPFSTAVQTESPVVTDFLPLNTSYEDGSITYPAPNNIPTGDIAFDSTGGALTWTLGSSASDPREVDPGAVFVAQFSVLVTGSAPGPAPDKTGNIVKLRTVNSAGEAASLRAEANFQIAAAPPVAITKGVASVDGAPAGGNPADTDHLGVREGSSVGYRVDVTNNGSLANSNALAVSNVIVWDVLPAGIACTNVPTVNDSGVCTDPVDAGQPSFTGNATRSAIVWTTAAPLAAGATRTLTYTVTVPNPVSVSADLVNTASVRSFDTITDLSAPQSHFPASNVDTTVPSGQWDAPVASDASDVFLPNVSVTKGVTSSINEAGNIGSESSPAASTQAVIGETVTYTVAARVPAHSSIFNAVLTDPMPTGLSLVSATAGFKLDADSSDPPGTLPSGTVFDANAPSVTPPATYDNTTATDQSFVMTITAQVTQLAANRQGVTRTNTAVFRSDSAATGGTAIPQRTATSQVRIVEPAVSLTKTNDGASVSAGQTVTYTLIATDTGGRPPLHDAWISDCLPAGLTFVAYTTVPGGVTTRPELPGDGTNGCAVGTTLLQWNLADLAAGTPRSLQYTATVDPTTSGQQTYVNTATLNGNSLAQARTGSLDPGNPAGRQYTASQTSTVTAAGATILKTVLPGVATIGDAVTYTASATLPAGINFYNLSLIDHLPDGIDAASLQLGTITCTNADTTPCSITTATPLTSSASTIGWLLGDVGQDPQVRTVTIVYSAKVADVGAATRGAALANLAHASWDTAPRTPPTTAGFVYDQNSTDSAAVVTVQEPLLSIAKAVSNAAPQPGDTFDYSLTVSNSSALNVSTAVNITVTDTVPAGVVVNPATISGGGTISGNDANGGGTISWTLPGSLAAGASATALTYQATLAPSATLTAAGLQNTARITGYDSRPLGGRHYVGPSTTKTVTPAFPHVTTSKATPSGTTAYIGEAFPWSITVTNTGGATALHVGTVDTLPANWTYDAGSAQVSVNDGPGNAVEPAVGTAGAVQALTWADFGTLPAGTSALITFTATPGVGVLGDPGVGLSIDHLNSATSTAQDATGASGNATGSYSAGPGTRAAHIASADVQVVKAIGTAPVAGGAGTWTLTVHNNGPDPAAGPFTVTDGFNDPLPTGVAITSATGSGWSCATSAPITCTRNETLANGTSFPVITIGYSIASTVPNGTDYTNTAVVGARTHDPVPANNSSTAPTTVTASADLSVAKDLSSELIAGRDATYVISVENAGPSVAVGPLTVTDVLPGAFVSVTADDWTCATGATLTCTLKAASLGVGVVPSAIVVTVHIPSGQTANVTNTATVVSVTPDPVPGNNASTVTTPPTIESDLLLQKTHLTSPFVAGQDAQYRMQVRNLGPSDATGVTVTDTLPADLSYVPSSADPNWSCSNVGALITCHYDGSLPPSETPTSFVITVHLDPTFTGAAVNTATVSSTTTDPVPSNNTDSDNSTTTTSADLAIAKSHTGTATAGLPLAYTLTVTNNGPSVVAGAVTVTDSLPVGLTFTSATGTGWVCGYDAPSRLITCTLAAGLGVTTAAAITVQTTVDSSAGPATISNTASVVSATPDPNLANNADTDGVSVDTSAAIVLTKTPASQSVLAGQDATFVLSVTNNGPSDAQSVVVTDTLPTNLVLKSATGTGWACGTGQTVVCSRDTVAAGTPPPDITLIATVLPSTPVGTLQNTAVVDEATDGTTTDPDPVDVHVTLQADLTLTKSSNATATAGSELTWSLAVRNTGPSDAAALLTVTDTLPDHETFVSSSGPWICTADTPPTVTCTLNAVLAADASAPPLDLVVLIDATAPSGGETNSATVSSDTPGTDGSDSATVTVGRVAALTVTKTHVGNGKVGQPLDFALQVHNDGPSVADQVVVVDTLPDGLSYDSFAGAGWACTAAEATVTCTLDGNLDVGADSGPLTITVKVGAPAYPRTTNVAIVGSTDPDLPGTQSTSDPVTVDPQAQLAITKTHIGALAVGSDGTYRMTVSNRGPTASPGPITVTDTLPAGLSYVGMAGTGWACTAAGQTVTCTRAGALAADSSTTVDLTVAISAGAVPSVLNAATVTGPGSSPDSATDLGSVAAKVELAVTKAVQSYENGVATYLITVTNNGPNDTVAPIQVVDALPSGLVLQSAAGSGWTCSQAANTVTCVQDSPLAVGSSTSLTVVAAVDGAAGTRIDNVATVSGGAPGAGSSNASSNLVVITVVDTTSPDIPDTGVALSADLEAAAMLLGAGLLMLLLGRRRRDPRRE